MDEGIPETNQHKQSKLNADINPMTVRLLILPHLLLVHLSIYCIVNFVSFSMSFYMSPFYLDAYIIKLFDRSVDLAQFNTTTPLYPICRSWMRNNPSVREPAVSPRSPQSIPEEEVGLLISLSLLFCSSHTSINKKVTDVYDSQWLHYS